MRRNAIRDDDDDGGKQERANIYIYIKVHGAREKKKITSLMLIEKLKAN